MKKINKIRLISLYSILFFAMFVFSYQLRGVILFGKIQSINFLAIISTVLIIFNKSIKFSKFGVILIVLLTMATMYSQLLNSKGFLENMVIMCCLIIPMVFIFLFINEKKFCEIFFKYIKWFNYLIILLFICAIVDKCFGNIIIKILSKFIYNGAFTEVLNGNNGRFFSFMGHPLYNTQLFLMFYIVNTLCGKYFPEKKNINMIYVILISTVGILFTASKTGIVLLVLLLIFTPSCKKNKLVYYGLIVGLFAILYYAGLFDNTIYRLQTQTLTSGRNEVWDILNQMKIFPLKFFNGYGSGFNNMYNYYVNGASMAFEYPFKLFPLEYGKLSAILIYCIILCYPLYRILKSKELYILISFGIIFVDVNTYNGIGLGMDIMFMFCLLVHFLVNLADYVTNNKEMDEYI